MDRIPDYCDNMRRLIADADLVVGNLESPVVSAAGLKRQTAVLMRHRMSADYLMTVIDRLGVDPAKCVLSVANNHIGDFGPDGLASTQTALTREGVTVVGGRNGDDPFIRRLRIKKVVVGVAAWTHWLNRDVFFPESGVWRSQHVPIARIKQLKNDQEIDVLIGAPHWEYEFHHFPRTATRRLASGLIRAGFDLLVGHHPHVIQPLERFQNGLCLYSIGNLHVPPVPAWPLRLIGLFEVVLHAAGPRKGCIHAFRMHPFVQQKGGPRPRITRLDAAPEDDRRRMAARMALLFNQKH